jgi:hypothetical protein
MADKKISALTSASTPLAGTEVLPLVQSSTTVKVSAANITAGRAVSTLSVASLGPNGIPITMQEITAAPSSATAAYVGVTTSAFPGGANGDLVLIPRSSSTNDVRILVGSGTPTDALVVQGSTKNILASAGNVVMSTAGKGIDFSANGGDVLSQYDEGTFTPVWNGGSITVGLSKYTRIGRNVVWIFDITFGASVVVATSTLTLPFPCVDDWGAGSINYTDVGATLVVNLEGSTDTLQFRATANSASAAVTTLATKRVVGMVIYNA